MKKSARKTKVQKKVVKEKFHDDSLKSKRRYILMVLALFGFLLILFVGLSIVTKNISNINPDGSLAQTAPGASPSPTASPKPIPVSACTVTVHSFLDGSCGGCNILKGKIEAADFKCLNIKIEESPCNLVVPHVHTYDGRILSSPTPVFNYIREMSEKEACKCRCSCLLNKDGTNTGEMTCKKPSEFKGVPDDKIKAGIACDKPGQSDICDNKKSLCKPTPTPIPSPPVTPPTPTPSQPVR